MVKRKNPIADEEAWEKRREERIFSKMREWDPRRGAHPLDGAEPATEKQMNYARQLEQCTGVPLPRLHTKGAIGRYIGKVKGA